MSDSDTLLDPALRSVVATADTEFRPYDRYGDPIDGMAWIPLQGDSNEGFESFLLKIQAGVSSLPHEHTGGESFFVLDGELTDCDGRVFTSGDYVAYQPGSRHYSVSQTGCTLLVILGGPNQRVAYESTRAGGFSTEGGS